MSLIYCQKLLPQWSIEELAYMRYLDLSFTRLKLANIDLLCKHLSRLKEIKIKNAYYISNNGIQALQVKYKQIKFHY